MMKMHGQTTLKKLPLFTYCCVYTQPYYPYVNQPKAHVSSQFYDVLIAKNISMNTSFILLEGDVGNCAREESVVVRERCEWDEFLRLLSVASVKRFL